ncbi:IclR family transcriptional regulator [Cytobacillus kochii]|uniref:IclR family transcriptional regulator n=1 Tax=Cytobacillus kochii TaxID=859143 RepID=UPI001CD6C051|nr:IclR family transcriptional regulator [Cytobacillus kochii]MCA1028020.1 IclR family transcriptional regulator [Cytobacillus kochii]
MKNQKQATIQSIQVGMRIIDLLVASGEPLRLSDIQEKTGITKSNLYKYLNTFTELDILYKDKHNGQYQLGSKLIEYGVAAIGQEDVISRVLPYLKDLSQQLDNTCLLTTWTYNGPIISKIWNPGHAYNIGAQLGSLLPPLSSTGKIFESFLDSATTKDWIKVMGKEGKGNVVEEINRVRQERIAFANEPLIPTVSSVSIPIFNYNQELLSAITVVGFSESIPKDPSADKSQSIIKVGKEISAQFGYRAKG